MPRTSSVKQYLLWVVAVCIVMLGMLVPPSVLAQSQVKPRIMLLVDTSGSMAWDVNGVYTYGDGSQDFWSTGRNCCPGQGGSRMYLAKNAMRQMVLASFW